MFGISVGLVFPKEDLVCTNRGLCCIRGGMSTDGVRLLPGLCGCNVFRRHFILVQLVVSGYGDPSP